MSFGAKKLRVQLPCGTDGSVVEDAVGGGDCDWPTRQCNAFTCAWGTCNWTPGDCGWTPVNCLWTPCNWSCPGGSCFPSPPPPQHCFGLMSFITPVACGQSRFEERPVVVDADQLPVLRERLEARLEEIKKAERSLEERRERDK